MPRLVAIRSPLKWFTKGPGIHDSGYRQKLSFRKASRLLIILAVVMPCGSPPCGPTGHACGKPPWRWMCFFELGIFGIAELSDMYCLFFSGQAAGLINKQLDIHLQQASFGGRLVFFCLNRSSWCMAKSLTITKACHEKPARRSQAGNPAVGILEISAPKSWPNFQSQPILIAMAAPRPQGPGFCAGLARGTDGALACVRSWRRAVQRTYSWISWTCNTMQYTNMTTHMPFYAHDFGCVHANMHSMSDISNTCTCVRAMFALTHGWWWCGRIVPSGAMCQQAISSAWFCVRGLKLQALLGKTQVCRLSAIPSCIPCDFFRWW